jgi:hypothetical protein
MAEMSELLASVYQTGAAPSDEDKEKIAAADMFVKICDDNGIKIEDLTEGQVQTLWKTAMEGNEKCPKCGEKDCKCPAAKEGAAQVEVEKKQAAAAEWQEKRAAAEKIAEADALGRIMAHSYVDELKKIAEGEGGGLPPALKAKMEEKKEEAKGNGGNGNGGEEKKEEEKEGAANESQQKAAALIAELEKQKSASTGGASTTAQLDELAANQALAILKEAEIDDKLAYDRVSAVYTLGLKDSEKIAHVQGFDQAVQVRALEFCEAAGFPVNWDQA